MKRRAAGNLAETWWMTDDRLLISETWISRSRHFGNKNFQPNEGLFTMRYLQRSPILLVLTIFAAQPSSSQWTRTNGPTGGQIRALTVTHDKKGGTTIFAGTFGGGVSRSTDNGAHWAPSEAGLPTRYFESMATMPDGPGGTVVFSGSYREGVFLSTDNGGSWNATARPSLMFGWTQALAVAGRNLFAGIATGMSLGPGVVRSTDLGATWSEANGGLTDKTINALATCEAGVFAGTRSGVFRSTDEGMHWTRVYISSRFNDVRALAVGKGANGEPVLFAGTEIRGMLRSTDGGSHWTTTDSAVGHGRVYALAVHQRGKGEVELFAGTIRGVYRSTDYGDSWTDINTDLVRATILSLAVVPHGNDGLSIFAGTEGDGMLLSTDRGRSWTEINQGLTGTTVYRLAVTHDNQGSANLFAGTWRGVFRSTDDGQIWTLANAGLADPHLVALAAVPNGTGGSNLVAGTQNGVFLSKDNGARWARTDSRKEEIEPCVFASHGSHVYAAAQDGAAYRSTDCGANWTKVCTSLPRKSYWGMVAVPDDAGGVRLFLVGPSFYSSTDEGASWTDIAGDLDGLHVMAITAMPDGEGRVEVYAGCYGGDGDRGGVYRFTSAGKPWTKVSKGNAARNPRSFAFAPIDQWGPNLFVAAEGGVFLATDRGETWSEIGTGLLDAAILHLAVAGPYLFAGTEGCGTWKRPLTEMLKPNGK